MNAEVDLSAVTLETERLILRPWREDDLMDFFEYAKVEGVGQMAGWAPHENIEKSREILSLFIEEKKTFALVLKETGKAIGSLGIEYCSKSLGSEFETLTGRELGFVLAKPYWGLGLMPEAVRRVIDWCFNEEGYDFLCCGHFDWNAQSAAVQKKCGFRFYCEGEFETRMGTKEHEIINVLFNEKKRA